MISIFRPALTHQVRKFFPPAIATPSPSKNTSTHALSAYRTQEQWDKILAAVGNAPSGLERQEVIEKIVAELKREREQVEKDSQLMSDPFAKQQQTGIHAAVTHELKSLLAPPKPGEQQQVPPQAPPSTQPNGMSPEDKARDTMLVGATT